MSFCGFAKGAAMYGATPIENLFILEHLPAAPESFVKVYLYARMLCLHPELGAGIGDVAAALRTDEDTVLNAMAYWEQRGLARRLTDRPPTFELLPVQGTAIDTTATMERAYYEYRDFNADLQALFPEKLLHPAEFSRAVDWINLMGFSQDAVLLAVRAEVEQSRGKSPSPSALFKRLDKKMLAWSERGIRTAADLERELTFTESVRQTAGEVLKRFAIRRLPSEDELTLVRRWIEQWHYAPEQILEACAETTKARTPTIAYLDAVLKNRLSEDTGAREELSGILRELDGRAAPPTPDELERYVRLRGMGFEPETVRLAAVQCHRKRKTRFEDLEWMLEEWQKLALFSHAAAEAYVTEMGLKRARMRQVMRLCGLERAPRMDDLKYLERWQDSLPDEVIDFAAGCAAGMQMPLRYMDKLLTDWDREGIRTAEAARARHEAKTEAAAQSGAQRGNPALRYPQRQYTPQEDEAIFLDLEQEFKDKEDGGDGA